MDIFPTSYALAGGKAKMPKPLDGVNLWPFMEGKAEGDPHDILFWKKLEAHAVRKGDWKYISSEKLPPMLFDLGNDLSESKNMAESNADKLKELQSDYSEWDKGNIEAWWGEGAIYVGKRMQMYKDFLKNPAPVMIGELKKVTAASRLSARFTAGPTISTAA